MAKSHLSFKTARRLTGYVSRLCMCMSYSAWCVYVHFSTLKHFPPHPSWLQFSPEATSSLANPCGNRDTLTSRTDMVLAQLRGDPLLIECLLCVKDFPHMITFIFHSNPMK